jgi:hypothetical protein
MQTNNRATHWSDLNLFDKIRFYFNHPYQTADSDTGLPTHIIGEVSWELKRRRA